MIEERVELILGRVELYRAGIELQTPKELNGKEYDFVGTYQRADGSIHEGFLVALRQMVLVHPLILMMMEIQFGNMERLLLWTESMY